MGLFKKKLSLEEIIEGIKGLSEEEQAKLKEEMTAPTEETVEETKEEVAVEEVENDNVAEEVEETTEEVTEEPTEAVAETEAVEETTEQTEEVATETPNEVETDNTGEIIEQLTNRLAEVEAQLSELNALKEKMEEFTKKQAEQFGYEGKIPGAKKDYKDMSASELSNELKSEI